MLIHFSPILKTKWQCSYALRLRYYSTYVANNLNDVTVAASWQARAINAVM